MLVQAAGLAEAAGTRLQLTTAGRKATTRPAHEVIRQVWEKWQKTTLVDEFNRINAIKGQQAKGRGLTAVARAVRRSSRSCGDAPRKSGLRSTSCSGCSKHSTRFSRSLTTPGSCTSASNSTEVLGTTPITWVTLQGRFVLTFLFEYVATLGLLDVAYVTPDGVRTDFHDRWGTDDLSCLSRYDGLLCFRINPLGAWCLGLAKRLRVRPSFQPSHL